MGTAGWTGRGPRRGRRGLPPAMAGGKGGSGKVPIKDMKAALVAAGWDTSDCFERADLEQKFALLSPEQQGVTAAAGGPTPGAALSSLRRLRDVSSALI